MKKKHHLGCPICGAHTIKGWVHKELAIYTPERRFEAKIECWTCNASFMWVYIGDKTTKKRDVERLMWQNWDSRHVPGGKIWKRR